MASLPAVPMKPFFAEVISDFLIARANKCPPFANKILKIVMKYAKYVEVCL